MGKGNNQHLLLVTFAGADGTFMGLPWAMEHLWVCWGKTEHLWVCCGGQNIYGFAGGDGIFIGLLGETEHLWVCWGSLNIYGFA